MRKYIVPTFLLLLILAGAMHAADVTNFPAGLFTTTGALKGNGSGVISQAACADLSNAAAGCSAAVTAVGTAAVGHIPGITTNTPAGTGEIGEYLSTNVASPGVAISTATDADVGTLSITAGGWLCHGNVFVIPAGTINAYESWIGTAANTAPTRPASGAITQESNISTTSQFGHSVGNFHVNSSGQTLHLGVNATFTSTATAYGFIGCLRVQ